jgi:uncharacterized protein (TIGR02145 family)
MTQEEFHKRYQYSPTKDFLGEGGFGKVFKAYDTHLDKWVAIKMAEVKAGLEQVRLKHEVEIVNKLPTHPNIAKYDECYTFSSFTGEYDFAVLQYYESGNLQQLLETKQLSEQQKDSILRQILAGIEFLHNKVIIHRDLKPQNILIVNRNGEYIPKITDFGISKKLDVNMSSVFTNSLQGAGTLSFTSPEQLLGNTLRKNTDLWSFGVISCWMFTGKLPFNSGSLAVTSEAGRLELFKQITAGDITAVLSQIPADWSNLVRQCLVVDVEKRVSGAGSCLEMLSGNLNPNNKEVPINNKNTTSETIIDTRKTVIPETKVANDETVTDIDGNIYKTVRIGNQTWMAENLKVTKYRNGDLIPNIKDDNWKRLRTGAWCTYCNLESDYSIKLYNWFAVNDKRNIAPEGWHVPSDLEWTVLIDFLGGKDIAGGKLKQSGTDYLHTPNKGATNESGFNAVLAGCRVGGRWGPMDGWWSTNENNESDAWYRAFSSDNSIINRYINRKTTGYPVRCIKDSAQSLKEQKEIIDKEVIINSQTKTKNKGTKLRFILALIASALISMLIGYIYSKISGITMSGVAYFVFFCGGMSAFWNWIDINFS